MRRSGAPSGSYTTEATSVQDDMPPPVTVGLGDAPYERTPDTAIVTSLLGDGLMEPVVYVDKLFRSLPPVSSVAEIPADAVVTSKAADVTPVSPVAAAVSL